MFDEFLSKIHDGRILSDVTFELRAWQGSEVVKVKYSGAWGSCNDGYHRWACMQAPCKSTAFLDEKRFFDWLESFRKDSECVFGTLKGRWRVLKTGIRLEGSYTADSIWMTCCALHNRLLVIDGLDGKWEGMMGTNKVEDVRRLLSFAVQRMENPLVAEFGSRSHEKAANVAWLLDGQLTSTSTGDSDDEDVKINEPLAIRTNTQGAIVVNSLSYYEFHKRLITHFDILHKQHKISWPKRK